VIRYLRRLSDSCSPTQALDPTKLTALLDEKSSVFHPVPAGLPPDCGVGHVIHTLPRAQPPYRPPYRMSPAERAEVQRQVSSLLEKGLIEPSASPYASPVLLVTKKDGSMRMCIDYRALKKITVRDRFPLPLLDDFEPFTIFSSHGLQSGYNQIHIDHADVEKMAFITPFGQYQFQVLSFGLSNAPATFQRLMNKLFAPYIGKFVQVYFDDIIIMFRSPEEHLTHLRLELLEQHK
jgi:hypothetical protein